MLSNKYIYRLLSTLALISLFAVNAIAAGSKQSSISPALENSTAENGELRISELVVPGKQNQRRSIHRSERRTDYLQAVLIQKG